MKKVLALVLVLVLCVSGCAFASERTPSKQQEDMIQVIPIINRGISIAQVILQGVGSIMSSYGLEVEELSLASSVLDYFKIPVRNSKETESSDLVFEDIFGEVIDGIELVVNEMYPITITTGSENVDTVADASNENTESAPLTSSGNQANVNENGSSENKNEYVEVNEMYSIASNENSENLDQAMIFKLPTQFAIDTPVAVMIGFVNVTRDEMVMGQQLLEQSVEWHTFMGIGVDSGDVEGVKQQYFMKDGKENVNLEDFTETARNVVRPEKSEAKAGDLLVVLDGETIERIKNDTALFAVVQLSSDMISEVGNVW